MPDEHASPGKKLKRNLQYLLSTGATSANLTGEMLRNATEAGVTSCSSRFLFTSNEAQVRSRTLFNSLLKGSAWPKLFCHKVG